MLTSSFLKKLPQVCLLATLTYYGAACAKLHPLVFSCDLYGFSLHLDTLHMAGKVAYTSSDGQITEDFYLCRKVVKLVRSPACTSYELNKAGLIREVPLLELVCHQYSSIKI